MGNNSSINHASFSRLHELTNNYNKATLLDKLIFWWQISNYTLGDDKIWFTRSLDQIAQDSKISKRSVERYLHDFERAGLIEKTNILFKKKNLYIRITEKLVALLNSSPEKAPKQTIEPTQNKIVHQQPTPQDSLFLNHFGVTESAKMAGSIYKDQDNNSVINSTVSQHDIVNNLKKQTEETKTSFPEYPCEKNIGERITERFKNYIKGTIVNLQTQHQLKFSNPDQLFAEIVFSVTNTENQFPGILDNHHRLNLIAKLLREKKWRTPKGFYNHWDIGQAFKCKMELKRKGYQQYKQIECNSYNNHQKSIEYKTTSMGHYQSTTRLNQLKTSHQEILSLISTETKYLKEQEVRFLKLQDDITKRIIQSTTIKLAKLQEESKALYQKIKLNEAA